VVFLTAHAQMAHASDPLIPAFGGRDLCGQKSSARSGVELAASGVIDGCFTEVIVPQPSLNLDGAVECCPAGRTCEFLVVLHMWTTGASGVPLVSGGVLNPDASDLVPTAPGERRPLGPAWTPGRRSSPPEQ